MDDINSLVKLKSIDIDEFDGLKSKIATVQLTDVEKKDFGEGEQEVRQVLIKSTILNTDTENPITASEYVNLKKEGDSWGYSDSPKAKATKIFKYFGVEGFGDLVGKDITVLKKIKENGKEYLGFNFGN